MKLPIILVYVFSESLSSYHLTIANIMEPLNLPDRVVNAAYESGSVARNNLTFSIDVDAESDRVRDIRGEIIGETRFFPKVCAFCDRHIGYGNENWFNIDRLNHGSVSTVLGNNFVGLLHKQLYGLSDEALDSLIKYYTQQFFLPLSGAIRTFNQNQKKYQETVAVLGTLVLSPRSYGKKRGNKYFFGCCSKCSSHMYKLTSDKYNDTATPPEYAIANGLMIGQPPKELERLNEVELALISPARLQQHLFSFSGGHHKSIRGWHTLFSNNVQQANRVINYYLSREQRGQSVGDNQHPFLDPGDDDSSHGSAESHGSDEDHTDEGNNTNATSPVIYVVLAGSFTRSQYLKTKERTEVRTGRVREALQWLKQNNILYKDIVIDDMIVQPHVINCFTMDERESGSNVEQVVEITSVFPDSNQALEINGGQGTMKNFKDATLERMARGKKVNELLISKPSSTIMRDYVDANLCKAFPKTFPYGTGWKEGKEGDYRTGTGYMRFLLSLSNPEFHTPSFVTVIYNMHEIYKMVRYSYLWTSHAQRISIGQINNEQVATAIERYHDDELGNDPADVFLKKLHATTGSMSHTKQAAVKARQNMFAFIAKYGLPAIMFTISPDDVMSFRIKIMSTLEKKGCQEPPSENANHQSMELFAIDCAERRTAFPSLSAMDFENILAITIHELMGWDVNKRKNIPDKGIFGDLDCYTYAVEEQGRGTLHAHFLLWVSGWTDIMDGLAQMSTRNYFERRIRDYAAKVMSCKLHRGPSQVCGCSSSLRLSTHCSLQDLRCLRTKKNETSLGERSFLKCSNAGCGKGYTSDGFATLVVDKFLSVPFENDEPLWFHDVTKSRRKMLLELHLMREFVWQQKSKKIPPRSDRQYRDTLFVTNLLRNLHSSKHAKSCFKKGCECRMKLPQPKCVSSKIHFDDDPKPWYTWKGINNPRHMFVFEQQRSHEDSFVNTYNEVASSVFGSNTNTIFAVSGGSIMYMTCYMSKNTQKEDKEAYAKGAEIMIRKINERLTELNEGENPPEESDHMKAGMRAVIGASLIATSSHVCSAPMAAYLTRNLTRFHFSHKIASANLKDFCTGNTDDYTIDSDDEGTPFIKSHVLNYLRRPRRFRDYCLYDSLSECTVTNKPKEELPQHNGWVGEHPSKEHQVMKNIKSGAPTLVPRITYSDFVDAKFFGGFSITGPLHLCTDDQKEAMELYAKTASILFVPHRKMDELRGTDGTFLAGFRSFLSDPPAKFKNVHQKILQNIQDCRNSLNAGRPFDVLERQTEPPPDDQVIGVPSERDQELTQIYDSVLSNNLDVFGENINFRETDTDVLSFPSSIIRDCGKVGCGEKLLITPAVQTDSTVFLPSHPPLASGIGAGIDTTDDSDEKEKTAKQRYLDAENLFELRTSVAVRKTIDGKLRLESKGDISNIRQYAHMEFGDDEHQKKAFELIVAAFVLEIYKVGDSSGFGRTRFLSSRHVAPLRKLNNPGQFVAFLSGAGGTGKSRVINGVLSYCKNLCGRAGIGFDKRTIVVTALTGSAAVSILGETTHSACYLNSTKFTPDMIKEWEDTRMVIIDEISFASETVLQKINTNLNILREVDRNLCRFGHLPILFAGDFTQLEPVRAQPLFINDNNDLWFRTVTTFIELKTNHRFTADPQWGKLLSRIREEGGTQDDIDYINTRLVWESNGISETDIPHDTVYATKNNVDRSAINEGIFSRFLTRTHSRDRNIPPPSHTICIKASDISFKTKNSRNYECSKDRNEADLIYASCGDGHVKSDCGKRYDPMLKLYVGRPLYINDNIDVPSCIANGAMCTFKGVTFKEGALPSQCVHQVLIDGYLVNSVEAKFLQSIVVQMQDGNIDESNPKIVHLEPTVTQSSLVHYPLPWDGPVTKKTKRIWRRIKFTQFPVNVANARTVHKLQGRSLKSVVISSWDYTGNWVYVVLSRCSTLKGIFLRKPLLKTRPMSEKNRLFHTFFRTRKKPPPEPDFVYT